MMSDNTSLLLYINELKQKLETLENEQRQKDEYDFDDVEKEEEIQRLKREIKYLEKKISGTMIPAAGGKTRKNRKHSIPSKSRKYRKKSMKKRTRK